MKEKFAQRIFDKENNCYLQNPLGLTLNGDAFVTQKIKQVLDECEVEGSNVVEVTEENGFVRELGTTCHDKKGNHIFEGDKVSFKISSSSTKREGFVEWIEGEFMINTPENVSFNLFWVVKNDKNIEIVGNIHGVKA